MSFLLCCPCCGCFHCINGSAPCEFDVTFTGFVNDACEDCDRLNDTFTLSWTGEDPTGEFTCGWQYGFEFPYPCSGPDPFNLRDQCETVTITLALGHFGGKDVIRVFLSNDTDGDEDTYIFEREIVLPFDCRSILNLDIPFLINEDTCELVPGATACGLDGMTCTISAV